MPGHLIEKNGVEFLPGIVQNWSFKVQILIYFTHILTIITGTPLHVSVSV